MSASHWILDKVQRSLRAYLQSQSFTWVASADIVAGIHRPAQENPDLEQEVHSVPWVGCVCQEAEATALHSGEWKATAKVHLNCSASDKTDDEFHAMCSDLMNALVSTTIAADLSASLADFRAEQVNMQGQSWSIEGRRWVAELTMEIYCLGADIPDS